MVWNDMQWYSYSLPFLLMQTFWMDTHWMDPYWWDTCWRYVLVGYVLVGYVCDSCWCTPFEWIRIAWIRIGGIRVERICIGGIRIGGIRIAKPADANVLNGYALHGYVLVGYVLNGYVLVGYVLVGYVLNGYVWDMCGVMDMCGICVVWDMCGICVVWDTPTIFWRTLRRNVFREKREKAHRIRQSYSVAFTGLRLLIYLYFSNKSSSHHSFLNRQPCNLNTWVLRKCLSNFMTFDLRLIPSSKQLPVSWIWSPGKFRCSWVALQLIFKSIFCAKVCTWVFLMFFSYSFLGFLIRWDIPPSKLHRITSNCF